MKVLLQDVVKKFESLINETSSREEIALWAKILQKAEDDFSLEYIPPEEEGKIWAGIIYLMGVDLKDFDGSYLHSLKNFKDFRKENSI